jgi:hypothetical protein
VKVLGTTLYHQFGTTGACNTSFTSSYIILGSNQVITENYLSAKAFWDSFPGFWFTNPNTNKTDSLSTLPNIVDFTIMYMAKHLYFTAQLEDYSHDQISDKALEDKACNALECYLNGSLVIHCDTPDNTE